MEKYMLRKLGLILATSATMLLAACGDEKHGTTTIAGTAEANPNLSTLIAVVKFAGDNNDLLNLLSGPGPLTVFAPTNAAFDALAVELTNTPTAKAADLLTTANKPLLKTVLQYHVLTSKVTAANIPFGKPITSAQGSIFKIDSGSPPQITDGRNRKANIITTDVDASNGVVHVIDKVILPADKTIVATAIASAPQFTTLVAALGFASNNNDLVNLLSGAGPFTVFAPTNAAFDALAKELTGNAAAVGADLLTAANKDLLRSVLSYHVVNSRVLKADVPVNTPITPLLAGNTFTISSAFVITDGRARTANIIITDVLTSNGVIHAIDKVILPRP
jgi:uncharacterized surface protein with fasciclin (FAS1) repeats